MNSEIASHIWLPEPELSFHSTQESNRSPHPLRGLLEYGPYSAGWMPNPIRVATLSPAGERQILYDFLKDLKSKHFPRERRDYLPDWNGFQGVFGIHVQPALRGCHIELDDQTEINLKHSSTSHVFLAETLTRAIHRLGLQRNDFEVLFIYLPRRWESSFVGASGEDFDLHDYLKAATALRGIPVQLVREDKALAYPCRASVMWRIGLALYVKAGGIPWKLAEAESETAYIGISYALRPVTTQQSRFVTCCSQVFDAEGTGLEFVAYGAKEVDIQGNNPFLSRNEMFRVMTRSVDLYRRRHAGKIPRRVIVHKTSEFRSEEIDGCMEALHLCEAVDLIQVVENVSWRGVRIESHGKETKGKATPFPVPRGTLIGGGPYDALLWIHGDVKGITRASYFQGSRSTPRPVRLIRHAGHGSWDETARAVLGLSKMNWNNDALYDSLPVTMAYAKVLSRVVKRMSNLGNTPYQFRFFM